MSASSRTEPLALPGGVGAWARERFAAPRFALLACALTAAGWAGAAWPGGAAFAGRVLLALWLVGALRLWDDLADRARDRERHPERVLARAASPRPFALALAAALAVGLASLAWLAPARAAGFALLSAGLAAWYARGSRRPWPHALVLLAKYPALALLVGASSAATWPRVTALSLLYLALVAYERATDPDLR